MSMSYITSEEDRYRLKRLSEIFLDPLEVTDNKSLKRRESEDDEQRRYEKLSALFSDFDAENAGSQSTDRHQGSAGSGPPILEEKTEPKRRKKRTIVKFLNGKPVTQQEFRDAIAEAIASRGKAKPIQIAHDLEMVTSKEGKHIVAQQMINMVRQGWLSRDDSGLYSLSPAYDARIGRSLEAAVVDVIQSYGGFATWSEIMEGFDTLPSANKGHRHLGGRGNGSQGRILSVMKGSKKIVRHLYWAKFSSVWCLSWDILLKVPINGRAFEWLRITEYLDSGSPAGMTGEEAEEKMWEDVSDHFDRVGLAFREARMRFGMDEYDAVKDPTVRDAFKSMKKRVSSISRIVNDEIRLSAQNDAAALGQAKDEQLVERLRDLEAEKYPAHMLALFEAGNSMMHKNAPSALYHAYAAQFGLCPVMLSHGVVMKVPAGSK